MKKTEDLKFGDPCEVRDFESCRWEKAIFGCDFSKKEGFKGNYRYSVLRNDGCGNIYKYCRPIQEPREFWVNAYGNRREYGKAHLSKRQADERKFGDREELLHLIEYSAFEQLQEENERLRKELEELKTKHD